MDTITDHGNMDSYNKELVYALQRTYVTWGDSAATATYLNGSSDVRVRRWMTISARN